MVKKLIVKTPPYRLAPNGDHGLTIIFDHPVGELLTRYILSLTEIIKAQFDTQVQQVIPAYQSLTIVFDPLNYRPEGFCRGVEKPRIEKKVEHILQSPIPIIEKQGRSVTVPVCYHGDFAPDLTHLASHCGMTIDQVIRLHSETDYLVNMLGFLPGFVYLSGLNARLRYPRKATPALRIEAGSVAIGGDQTGIYPVASPGGWHIIGRTPLLTFVPDSPSPFIANPLDTIRFVPIERGEFEQLAREFQRNADL